MGEYVPEHRRNLKAPAGKKLEDQLANPSSTRAPSVSSQSSGKSSEPARPKNLYKEHLTALRLQNDFCSEAASEHICYFTGAMCSDTDVQKAHLVPHSETRMANAIDGMQHIGTLPNIASDRRFFKSTSANLLPVYAIYHLRMDSQVPQIILAPLNEDLRKMIKAIERSYARAEAIVHDLPDGECYATFSIDLNNIIRSSQAAPVAQGVQYSSLRFGNVVLALRTTFPGVQLVTFRQSTDAVPHTQVSANIFPLDSVPPIPAFSTLLNMANVTIVFLYRIRQLQEQGVLAPLSPDMEKTEEFARYFISLICLDNLKQWRTFVRPASLNQAQDDEDDQFPAPPIGYRNPSVRRTFLLANLWEDEGAPDTVEHTARKRDDVASDPPEGKENTETQRANLPKSRGELKLGTKEESSVHHGIEESTAALSLEGSFVDDSLDGESSGSRSDEWSTWTGPTSPNTSGENKVKSKTEQASSETRMEKQNDAKMVEKSADSPQCAACLADAQELQEIETQRIPKAKRQMRALFADRAQKDGMRVALEEVFFRREGLEVYREVQSKLEALADDVERLQSGYIEEEDEEKHECLGPRKKRSSAVVQDE